MIEKKEGIFTDNSKKELKELPDGKWEIVKPQRTKSQNSLIHALFPEMATALNDLNVPLTFGKGSEASWNRVTAKEVFFKSLYTGGKDTSKCSTQELANAVDTCLGDFAKKGIHIEIKEIHREEYDDLMKNRSATIDDFIM